MPDEQPQEPMEQDSNRRRHPLLDAPSPPPSDEPKRKTVSFRFPDTVRVPRVTYILIAINLIIWGIINFMPDLGRELVIGSILNTEAVINFRQLHRLVTSMFLHTELFHVLFNCIALYYIGSNVERCFGHIRYLIIYLLGGLAGSILSLFFYTNALGASGAVFAIWGAEAVFFYQHRQLFGEVAKQRLRSTGFLVLFNFAIGFLANAQGTVAIGNVAHLGGLVGGAILTWWIGPRFVAEPVEKTEPGKIPIRILQVNPLSQRVREILIYSSGLAALLFLAIMVGT
jgi:rhomboid protease GluP